MSALHADPWWWSLPRARGDGLALRLLALVSPLVAVACTWLAAGRAVPLVAVVVFVFTAVCAAAPDSHAGLGVVLIVCLQWLYIVGVRASPWALAVAGALAVFHTSLAAATIAPPAATWTRAMRRRWLRRFLGAIATSAGTWVAVKAIDGHHPGGDIPLLVAALVLLALAAAWADHRAAGPGPTI
jgi:hypothetical protein